MKKFKVTFAGFTYVEAESESEAIEKAQDGDTIYEEQKWEDALEVPAFIVDGEVLS